MSYKGKSQKPPRKDCTYNEQEMEVLRPFKEEYETSTQEQRVIIMKSRMLPTLFNYWTAKGKRPTEKDGPGKAQVNGKKYLGINSDTVCSNLRGGAQTTGAWLIRAQ